MENRLPRKTPKDFLMLAWQIDSRIDRKIDERERLQEKLTAGRMSNLSGMPRGGQYDWTNAAAKIVDIDSSICAEIAELCKVKRLVNDAIDSVVDMRYRCVLELRYRNYLSWEKISKELGYDLRHVYRLHGEALLQIHVPEEFA